MVAVLDSLHAILSWRYNHMAFFTIAFFWLFGLFLVSISVSILFLFIVYRLTGGKQSFLAWFKAMRFWDLSPCGIPWGLFCCALLSPSAPIYGLFMPFPMFYHCHIQAALVQPLRAFYGYSILRPFPGPLSGFFYGGYRDIGQTLKTPWRGLYKLTEALYPVRYDMPWDPLALPCVLWWLRVVYHKICLWSKCIN